MRSPYYTTHKPDRLFPQIKQRSPLNTHQTRSQIPQIKQRSPLSTHKCDRLNLNIKQQFLVVKATGKNSDFIV
ncbi:hypothetical protein VB774_23985 [Pseudanabaena galeata UHCC 0370]|uniref:Uncharacterized protein n=1 Tax=Pseudanabaena galeata UHCC 0370 TaxID=3110310 RepID=A0ABU5TQX4_9CYAN|nr:hypothetical protein [Pseudanabaena galeata]MEA5480706.1 hypothetical protein [Pseudanabaena galeata UHCC 0370]